MGDKYGGRPIPSIIEGVEFENIRRSARIGGKDVTLMDDWFMKDCNAVPHVYVLQPITSKLDHFNDDAEENADKKQEVSIFNNILLLFHYLNSKYSIYLSIIV